MMFQPSLFSTAPGSVGIVEFTRDVIMTCDAAVQPLLWKHVVLSGGNTMIAGKCFTCFAYGCHRPPSSFVLPPPPSSVLPSIFASFFVSTADIKLCSLFFCCVGFDRRFERDMRELHQDPSFRLVYVGLEEHDLVNGAVTLAQLPSYREKFCFLPAEKFPSKVKKSRR